MFSFDVKLMVGGPVGEAGVPVQLLVLWKDITPRKNFVKELAPAPLHPRFHEAETARALIQTPALAAEYLSVQVIYFFFFLQNCQKDENLRNQSFISLLHS